MSVPKKERPLCKNCGQSVNLMASVYCSNTCQSEYQYRDYIRGWKAGELCGLKADNAPSGHVRRYLIERDGEKCSECGWAKRHPITERVPLEIHHINGNHMDNSENNLKLLCPNCHSLTPTFKALNKGNGRVNRRKLLDE